MLTLPLKKALTFDDVLIVPSMSQVHPNRIDISTRLTRHISINIPLISAAMDTVTESSLAISLAQLGGVGVIHKNLSIEKQAAEVARVKRSESGMIQDPITMDANAKLSEVKILMDQYHISGVPILEEGKLVGILTNRDLRFETRWDLPVREIMTKDDLVTVPEGTTLEQARIVLQQHRIEKLLVVDPHGVLKGLITVKDIEKSIEYPRACKDANGQLLVGAAIGISSDMLQRAEQLASNNADFLCLDSSHGHSEAVLSALKEMKKHHPKLPLIVGNIATRDGAQALIDCGADAVKVGVGPGSICTTRIVTGAGMPQITAIAEAAQACVLSNIPCIADGGIKYSGDITKAIAAGADSVMIGGLLAGTDEAPGETIFYGGRTFKTYRGMGSLGAMKDGSRDRYFQEAETEESKLVPEGIEGQVPYKGKLKDVVEQLLGGLRAGMGLGGAKNIQDFKEHARFVEITNAGLRESHAHDVMITKESPNYRND